MSYCPNCGAPLEQGQSFCGVCGYDLRARWTEVQTHADAEFAGLTTNALFHISQRGLEETRLLSVGAIAFSFVLPLVLLVGLSYVLFPLSSAAYGTLWLASSLLLFDELRGREVRRLLGGANDVKRRLVEWSSLGKTIWDGKSLSVSSRYLSTSISLDKEESSNFGSALASWGTRVTLRLPSPTKRRLSFATIVLLLFVIAQLILISGAVIPFFPGEEARVNSTLSSAKNAVQGSIGDQFLSIYLNNLNIAIGTMLPGLGTLLFGAASFNTGRVIQEIGVQSGVNPLVVIFGLFLFPHSWVEEFSYPIAAAAGILYLTRWRGVSPADLKVRMRRGSMKFASCLVLSGLTLVLAGALEVIEPVLGLSSLLLWLPVSGLIIVVWRTGRFVRWLQNL